MITHKIYTSLVELPESWDSFVVHDVFLQIKYLKALEVATPKNISWYYIGVFKNDELVGIAIIQRAQLYLKDMFRSKESSVVKQFFVDNISKFLKGNILVVGNLTHTGQHGLYFNQDKISQVEFLKSLYQSLEQLKTYIKKHKHKRIRIIMLKDYFSNDVIHNETEFFKSNQLYKVHVQPNMIMEIESTWTKWEDYVLSLNKKYRTRYKRAKKKFGNIQKQELNIVAIKENSEILYKLYKNVSNNAKFNTFILPQGHFYNLKLQLKEDFKVFGYYLENELIGFYTLILNNTTLETYFLGYNVEYQYKNQLYLNMLYDMATFAIENKFSSVIYARTAMEIKSSVGAKPKEMIMYMKHTNRLANFFLRLVFSLMNPTQKWEERHPFKA